MENSTIILLLVLIIVFGISTGLVGYMLGWRNGFNSAKKIRKRGDTLGRRS